MRLISVEMPDTPFHGIDELVKRGIYPSRTAVMRAAVGDLLQKGLLPRYAESKPDPAYKASFLCEKPTLVLTR